jgi:hypothetical protein
MATRLHAARAALRGIGAEKEVLEHALDEAQKKIAWLQEELATAVAKQEELSEATGRARPTHSTQTPLDPWEAWLNPTAGSMQGSGVSPAQATASAGHEPTAPSSTQHGSHLLALKQRERRALAIRDQTRRKGASLAASYIDFCHRHRYPDPTKGWDKYVLSEFLWHKAQALTKPNAASWADWQSRLVSYTTLTWELPELSQVDRSYLRTERLTCQKSVGVRTFKQTPVGRFTLRAIHDRTPQLTTDARLRATFDQLVIMLSLVVRAGEVADTGRSRATHGAHSATDDARVELDALPQARDVTFIPPTKELPHGAVRLLLYDTKRERLTGEGKREGEPAFAAGTGDVLCPVAALRRTFEAHNLYDKANEQEFIFAALQPSGRRMSPATPGDKASPITSREFNEQIAKICTLAQWPTFTMRATRYGACCDMEAAGVPSAIANAAGRWKEGSRAPYSSMTLDAAAVVARRTAELRTE